MNSHTTVIVEWHGPYSYDEIEENKHWNNGLYLATGKLRYEREATIQYCGITEGGFHRRMKNHHKIHEINRDQKFWIGTIKYPERGALKILCHFGRISTIQGTTYENRNRCSTVC